MKRSGAAKFPHSVQLFKFCQKVLIHQKGTKVHDQEVGAILNFNPSDCSHWKRGEKNVRSVFALAKLAESLGVETSLIHEVASSEAGLDEAYFEYLESKLYQTANGQAQASDPTSHEDMRSRILAFVSQLLDQAEFKTPPLYLPEVFRFFSFVATQPIDMVDKLSRILRVKSGKYAIHFRRGDLKPQTRMSLVKDLARILFEAERARFPELGPAIPECSVFEQTFFTANLLVPKQTLLSEIARLDTRKNMISELAALFWVPKSLISYQLQDMVRTTKELQASRESKQQPSAASAMDYAELSSVASNQ